jgi:hypothetical protein
VLSGLSVRGYLLNDHDRLRDLAATLWTRAATAPPGLNIDALRGLAPVALTACWGLPDADNALLRVLEGHTSWCVESRSAPMGACW